MRISTNVTNRLPNSVYNFHDTEKENDFGTIPKYLGESEKLRAELESTRAKMLALAKKMASIELAFWRKVLFSKETPEAGLRVAMVRIRNLWKELGYGEEAFKDDLQLFQRRVYTMYAIKSLEYVKSWIETGYVWGSCDYLWRYLRKGGLAPNDIGSSDTELQAYAQQFTRFRMRKTLKIALDRIRDGYGTRIRGKYYYESDDPSFPNSAIAELRKAMRHYKFICSDLDTTEEELENLSKGCSKSRSE